MIILLPAMFFMQSLPAIKKEIDQQYLKWDKAVVAHNITTLDSMMAVDFWAKLAGPEKPTNKKGYIAAIKKRWNDGGTKELAYMTKIDKIEVVRSERPKLSLFAVTIQNDLIFKLRNGSKSKFSQKLCDTWQKSGVTWQIVKSENLD